MNRNSGNAQKTKKVISGAGNNSKHNRKFLRKLSDSSSSTSSNRNSSDHSEEDARAGGGYLRPQVDRRVTKEEQEQVTRKLQAQVKELRHKLRVLGESMDSKDYSLGTIAREKDRAMGEIRRLERNNKLLRQQLNEERTHYLEEKEKFCEEMTRYKKKLQKVKSETDERKARPLARPPLISHPFKWQSRARGDFVKGTNLELKKSKSQRQLGIRENKSFQLSSISFQESQIRNPSSLESLRLYGGNDVALQLAALRTENAKLRSIICERDERNYELCLRFLRMKHYKNDIRERFMDLENEYLQVIANLLEKIDEARQEFNFIIDQKFKKPLHSGNAMYLKMIQKNSRMAFENASLRLENQCLKKEIYKYMTSSSEYDSRRIESTTANEEAEGKLVAGERKSEEVLKRIKKNVNFKEVRTIYEREFNLKTSDTDSNYMSKTSTAPSNVSLGEPKSSESAVERKRSGRDKGERNFQGNFLPEEILNRLFKRVDSSSSHTLDTNPSKQSIGAFGKNDCKVVAEASGDRISVREPASKPDPPTLEDRGPSKPAEHSSNSDSKVFVGAHDAKKSAGRSPRGVAESSKPTGRKKESSWTFKSPWRKQVRGGWNFDTEEGTHLDFSLGRFILPGKSRQTKREKAEERQAPKPLVDGCGLQEKIELSDVELPGSAAGASEKARNLSTRTEDSEEYAGGKSGKRGLTPAVGSRSRSSNKLSLYDEIMEMSVCGTSPGPTEGAERWDSTGQRKPETKRFSHRLFSSSPEQLRTILRESQLGRTLQMCPKMVGHATTEVAPSVNPESSSNETYEQEVPTPENPSLTHPNAGTSGRHSNAKETPAFCGTPRPNSPDKEATSDLRLPLSGLPTSNSTVEMEERVAVNRTRIMMRTLSSPGLLESSWLDPYAVCEMKDCSTNT